MKPKSIILIVLALIAIGGVVAWAYINKPAEKVENAKALEIRADELTNSYAKDEAAANKMFLNQAIEVTGTIAEISKNQDGKTVVLLESEDPMSGVQCTMRDEAKLETGKQVRIKGFCTGYTMVVLLGDCIVI
ncbi:MAG TPA: hypothetical protein VL098_07830 [Flavipsychrobacter sp.]|nr:hypothetical protein [Flavipsychrobacter sp.]